MKTRIVVSCLSGTIAVAIAVVTWLVVAAPAPQAQEGGKQPAAKSTPGFGEAASATVRLGAKALTRTVNQVGSFGRINVAPKARASVDLAYAGGKAGDFVVVQPVDGGKINGIMAGKRLALDSRGRVNFTFDLNQEAGLYRVVLVKKKDRKVLEFWVGDPLPVSNRRKS